MSVKKFTGITKQKHISLSWNSLEEDSYIVLRNRSYDDTVYILQEVEQDKEVAIVNDSGESETVVKTVKKIVKTPIPKTEDVSFLVKNPSLRLELHTDVDYSAGNADIDKRFKGLTVVISDNKELNERGVKAYVADILNAYDFEVSSTWNTKGETYFKNKDNSYETVYARNSTYPNPENGKDVSILAGGKYTGYFIAGRGFILKSVTGKSDNGELKFDSIWKQTEALDYEIGTNETNQIDSTVDTEIGEVPYEPVISLSKQEIVEYNNGLRNNPESIKEWTPVLGNAMFLVIPQQKAKSGSYPRIVNFVNNSGIDAVGTQLTENKGGSNSADDPKGVKEINISGYVNDPTDVTSTQKYIVDENSKFQWKQEGFEYNNIYGFSVDIQTTSKNYPYTISFSGPYITGITFNSDTEIVVQLRDRRGKYRNIDHFNKQNRYTVVYNTVFVELYINGVKQEQEVQENINMAGKVVNTLGYDVKSSYMRETGGLATLSEPIEGSASGVTMDIERDDEYLFQAFADIKVDGKQAFILPLTEDKSYKNSGIVPFGFNEKDGGTYGRLLNSNSAYNATTNPRALFRTIYKDNLKEITKDNIVLSIPEEGDEVTVRDFSVVNAETNDKQSITSGLAVENLKWLQMGYANNERTTDDDGYSVPEQVEIDRLPIYVSDSSLANEIEIDQLKTKLLPAFFGVKRGALDFHHKAFCNMKYKIREINQEGFPLSANMALGTTTMRPYLFYALDNSTGRYDNDESLSQLLRGYLTGGMLNFIGASKTDSNKLYRYSARAGYRGANNTNFPDYINGTPTNLTQAIGYDETVDSVINIEAQYGAKITLTVSANTTISVGDFLLPGTEYNETTKIISLPTSGEREQVQITLSKEGAIDRTITLMITLSPVPKVVKQFDRTVGYIEFKLPYGYKYAGNAVTYTGQFTSGYQASENRTKRYYRIEFTVGTHWGTGWQATVGSNRCSACGDGSGKTPNTGAEIKAIVDRFVRTLNFAGINRGDFITIRDEYGNSIPAGKDNAGGQWALALNVLSKTEVEGQSNQLTLIEGESNMTFPQRQSDGQDVYCLNRNINSSGVKYVYHTEDFEVVPETKYFLFTLVPFSELQVAQESSLHEDKLTTGQNLKGCFGILQIAETRNDQFDYIGVRMLQANQEFQTKRNGFDESSDVMETEIGKELVSTANIESVLEGVTDVCPNGQEDFENLPSIFKLGAVKGLSNLFDLYITDFSQTTTDIRGIVKFKDVWDSGYIPDNFTSGDISVANKPYPANSQNVPKFANRSSSIFDDVKLWTAEQLGNNLKDIYVYTAQDFRNMIGIWNENNTQYAVSSENIEKAVRNLDEIQSYKTKQYRLLDLYAALEKAVGLNVAYDFLNDAKTIFNMINNGNGVQIEYGETYKTYFSDSQLVYKGIHEGMEIRNPGLFVWKGGNTVTGSIYKYEFNEVELQNYYPPKEHIANLGNLVIHGAKLSEDDIKGDLEWGKLWYDYEGLPELTSSCVPTLHTIKEVLDSLNPTSAPYLNPKLSDFEKNLYYGRIKPEMPQGARFFINLTKSAWKSDTSRIVETYWEPGTNFEKYYFSEEVYNPDLECQMVWFGFREGVLDPDYWRDKNNPNIHCSLFYCAKDSDGIVTEKEIRFEIVKPVVFGLITKMREKTGVNATFNRTNEAVNTIGTFWFLRYLNKDKNELKSLGLLQPIEVYRYGLGFIDTPSKFVYKDNTSKVIRIPKLLWGMYGEGYDSIVVSDSEGNAHKIPRPARENKIEGLNTSLNSYYGWFRAGSRDCYRNRARFGQVFNDRFDCQKSAGIAGNPYYFHVKFKILGENKPFSIIGTWRFCQLIYDMANKCFYIRGAVNHQTISWSANPLKKDTWYYVRMMGINENTSSTISTRNRWDILEVTEDFQESDIWDDTKWTNIVSEKIVNVYNNGGVYDVSGHSLTGGRLIQPGILIGGGGETYLNNGQTDLSIPGVFEVSSFLEIFFRERYNFTYSDTTKDEYWAKLVQDAKTHRETQKIESDIAWSGYDPMLPNFDDSLTVEWLRTGEECETSQEKPINSFIPSYSMLAAVDGRSYCYTGVSANTTYDSNAFLAPQKAYAIDTPASVFNAYSATAVEGFQESAEGAMILDKTLMKWFLPKSPLTKFLQEEAGLPYCHDYHRPVRFKWLGDYEHVDEMENNYCYKDSINYEWKPNLLGGIGKHVAPNGKEWSSRADYQYEAFQYQPRFQHCLFDFYTISVKENLTRRYRFYAVSMGEFSINPVELLQQIRGTSYEIITKIEGWHVNTHFFHGTDKHGEREYISSSWITATDNVLSVPTYSNRCWLENVENYNPDGTQNPDVETAGFWRSVYPAVVRRPVKERDNETLMADSNRDNSEWVNWDVFNNTTTPYLWESAKVGGSLCALGGAPSKFYSGRVPAFTLGNKDFIYTNSAKPMLDRHYRSIRGWESTSLRYAHIQSALTQQDRMLLDTIEKMGTQGYQRTLASHKCGLTRVPGTVKPGVVTETANYSGSRDSYPVAQNTSRKPESWNVVGVGVAEYVLQWSIENQLHQHYDLTHPGLPIIDYRYADVTKDNFSVARGFVGSNANYPNKQFAWEGAYEQGYYTMSRGQERHLDTTGGETCYWFFPRYGGVKNFYYVPYGYNDGVFPDIASLAKVKFMGDNLYFIGANVRGAYFDVSGTLLPGTFFHDEDIYKYTPNQNQDIYRLNFDRYAYNFEFMGGGAVGPSPTQGSLMNYPYNIACFEIARTVNSANINQHWLNSGHNAKFNITIPTLSMAYQMKTPAHHKESVFIHHPDSQLHPLMQQNPYSGTSTYLEWDNNRWSDTWWQSLLNSTRRS